MISIISILISLLNAGLAAAQEQFIWQDAPRMELFSCTTDGAGQCSVVYFPSFNSTPMVTPTLQAPGTINYIARVSASSISGFTIIVEQHTSLSVLSLNVLSFAATPVAGQNVKIMVAGK